MIVGKFSLSEAMKQVASANRGSYIFVGDQAVEGLITYHHNDRLRVKLLEVEAGVKPAFADAILARTGWRFNFLEGGTRAWHPPCRR